MLLPKGTASTWILQILFNLTMLTMGITTNILGPTLLKLEEHYDSDTETISYMFLASSLVGLPSLFVWTISMDKLPKWRMVIFAAHVFLQGLSSALFPYGRHVTDLIAISIFNGVHSISVHCGINVLCLELWRGQNPGPFVHSLHLAYSIGGFIAPLLAKPFIGDSDSNLALGWLYILTAIPCCLVGLGILTLALLDRGAKPDIDGPVPTEDEQPSPQQPRTLAYWSLLGLMFIFVFTYIVLEYSLACYLPAVAVKMSLNLTMNQGANIFATYMGGFVISRALAIVLAIKVKSGHVLAINLATLLCGSFVLSIFGEESPTLYQVGYGLTGLGMGSMFANKWVWLEHYILVSHRVGNLLNFGAILGGILSPLIMGNLADTFPMILIHMQLAVTIATCFICGVGALCGQRVKAQSRSA